MRQKAAPVSTAKTPVLSQTVSSKPARQPNNKPPESSKAEPAGKASRRKAPRPADLPLISVLSRPVMDRAKQLMEDAIEYGLQIKALKEALKETKEGLLTIARENELEHGMRWGSLAAVCSFGNTKRTLSAKLLVENGVAADVVEASYQRGKVWDEVSVKDLRVGVSSGEEEE